MEKPKIVAQSDSPYLGEAVGFVLLAHRDVMQNKDYVTSPDRRLVWELYDGHAGEIVLSIQVHHHEIAAPMFERGVRVWMEGKCIGFRMVLKDMKLQVLQHDSEPPLAPIHVAQAVLDLLGH